MQTNVVDPQLYIAAEGEEDQLITNCIFPKFGLDPGNSIGLEGCTTTDTYSSLEDFFKECGVYEVETLNAYATSGSCQFSALGEQIYNELSSEKFRPDILLRQIAVDSIRKNPCLYEDFLLFANPRTRTQNAVGGKSVGIDDYTTRMDCLNCDGDHITLQALADSTSSIIYVIKYLPTGNMFLSEIRPQPLDSLPLSSTIRSLFYLPYRTFWLSLRDEAHYKSLHVKSFHHYDFVINDCPICHEPLNTKIEPNARLNCCRHLCHSSCLIDWITLTDMCPLCKIKSNYLYTLNAKGTTAKKITIKKQYVTDYYRKSCRKFDPSDDIVCAICGYGDKEKQLLLCDSSCGKAYHTFCIGLEEVPEGDWYCTPCRLLQERKLSCEKNKIDNSSSSQITNLNNTSTTTTSSFPINNSFSLSSPSSSSTTTTTTNEHTPKTNSRLIASSAFISESNNNNINKGIKRKTSLFSTEEQKYLEDKILELYCQPKLKSNSSNSSLSSNSSENTHQNQLQNQQQQQSQSASQESATPHVNISNKRRRRNPDAFVIAQSPIFGTRRGDIQPIREINNLSESEIIELMDIAANDDIELVNHKKNPTKKLLLFPQVHFKIRESSASLHKFLNVGLLNIIIKWLSPFPNNEEQPISVRLNMLRLIEVLPIRLSDLRKCQKLGKVILHIACKETKYDLIRERAILLIFRLSGLVYDNKQ